MIGRLLVIFIVFFLMQAQASERPLKMLVGIWCPYNCHDGSKINGYVVDLIVSAYGSADIEVVVDYSSFGRAIKLLRSGDIDLYPTFYKSDAPDLIFSKSAIGTSQNWFFVRKSTQWEYSSFESLKKIDLLGLIPSYSYEEPIEQFKRQFPQQIVYNNQDNEIKDLLRMLVRGRISAIYDDIDVVRFYARELSYLDDIKLAGSTDVENDVFVGFSPMLENVEVYRNVLENKINELRNTGELKSILDRYHVSDWVE